MVASARDLQPQVRMLLPGHSPEPGWQTLFLYNASTVQHTRSWAWPSDAPAGPAGKCLVSTPGWMTRIRSGRDAAGYQIVPRALADGMESRTAVSPGRGTLGCPYGRGNRPRGLGEGGGAEEVGNDGAEREPAPEGEKERQLVDVFHQDVGPLGRDRPVHRSPPQQREAVPSPDPLDVDAVDIGPSGAPRSTPSRPSHPMAARLPTGRRSRTDESPHRPRADWHDPAS